MKIKSWFEAYREEYDPENSADKRAEAIAEEAAWRASGKNKTNEDDIMCNYASERMGHELFSLGEYIIQQHPDPADAWWLSESVYHNYAYYYMLENQPAEAIPWYLKALDNKLPYPYSTYKSLAAAYIEVGDYEQADLWIGRYIAHERSEQGTLPAHDWLKFAKYYHDIDRQQMALFLMLEVYDETKYKYKDFDYYPMLGKIYAKLGEVDKSIAAYQKHLKLFSYDPEGYAMLGLTYYDGKQDVRNAETCFLQAIDAGPNYWKDTQPWNVMMYENLSVIHASYAMWEKCYAYMKQYYMAKYPPAEAALLVDMLEHLPEIEDDAMGYQLYHTVKAFEDGHLRPTRDRIVPDKVAEDPLEEVRDATSQEADLSDLLTLDKNLSN